MITLGLLVYRVISSFLDLVNKLGSILSGDSGLNNLFTDVNLLISQIIAL